MDFFQHDVSEREIEYVSRVIRNGDLTTGKVLKEFAQALVSKFNFPEVVLCSSGTSALHLAMIALGIGPGDEVITTPYVGVWTVNTILMTGATPVFADIDRKTYNLDPKLIWCKVNEHTKVVMPVSVFGNPCDLKGIRLSIPYNVRVICDDIEALGSKRNNKFVGEDIGNDISVGGFWVSKQVTTAGGGMVVSEDVDFLNKFEKLTRHGHGLVGNMWEQNFGFNAWLCDPMAAMGVIQLDRFQEKQNRLLKVKYELDRYFRYVRCQVVKEEDFATEFIYVIELPVGVDKRKYSNMMYELGIPTRPYFQNLLDVKHLKKYKSWCPVCSEVSSRTIALPYHWKLSSVEVQSIAKAHERVLSEIT